MSETKKPEYVLRLSENYAIDTDPRNIVLLERYETRNGKGRSAPLSGNFKWKEIGYFRDFNQIANRLVEKEVFNNDGEIIEQLHDMTNRVEKLKEEMAKFLNEKIELKVEGK